MQAPTLDGKAELVREASFLIKKKKEVACYFVRERWAVHRLNGGWFLALYTKYRLINLRYSQTLSERIQDNISINLSLPCEELEKYVCKSIYYIRLSCVMMLLSEKINPQ